MNIYHLPVLWLFLNKNVCVAISKLCSVPFRKVESYAENTDDLVVKIARELDVDISKDNIDRSHRVGKPTQQERSAPDRVRPRDILVKFSTYNARQQLYGMRKELRHSDDDTMKNLFINEDLTKKRSKLLYDARSLLLVENLSAAYSQDGRIFVRDNRNNRVFIQSDEGLGQFGDPQAARKELARLARLPPHLRRQRNAGNIGGSHLPTDSSESAPDHTTQNEQSSDS